MTEAGSVQATMITHGACESVFRVDLPDGSSETVRLWIITGGTPALALADYSYTLRYPVVERFSNKHWLGSRYDHQVKVNDYQIDPASAPNFDVLPNGLADLESFLLYAIPRRNARDARMAQLPPVHEIKSRRVHDKENRTYTWAKVEIRQYGVSPITFDSGCYWGRCEDRIGLFSSVWQDALAALNPIFDRHDGTTAWEDLTDQEFEQVKSVLWTLYQEQQIEQERRDTRRQQERDRAMRAWYNRA